MKRVALISLIAVLVITVPLIAGEVGYATVGSTGFWDVGVPSADHQANDGASYQFTASVDERIDTLGIHGYSSGGTGSMYAAIYDITSGVNGADSVTSVEITLTASTSGAAQWEMAYVGVELTAGHTYMIATGNESGTCYLSYDNLGANGGSYIDNNSDLPAQWTDNNSDWVISSRGVTSIPSKKVGLIR